MDIYMHQALEKIRNWFDKATIWQKDLFCTLWESTKKDEKILDREINLIAQEYFGESHRIILKDSFATVYKGNIIKNLIMDCQSYTKYRPNETTGGIFVSWRRKEELPTGA